MPDFDSREEGGGGGDDDNRVGRGYEKITVKSDRERARASGWCDRKGALPSCPKAWGSITDNLTLSKLSYLIIIINILITNIIWCKSESRTILNNRMRIHPYVQRTIMTSMYP